MINIKSARSKGFSLGELIVVIIILGILSAIALAIFIETRTQHRVTTQADEFRRNLSRIQLLAISQGWRLRMDVSSVGDQYQVFRCTDANCTTINLPTDPATALDPNTGLYLVQLKDGATLSPAGSSLFFDTLGRPQDGTGLITLAREYTLSGSGRSVKVSVLPITGFAVTTY